MGNLCECLEQQPPPEERKKKKEHKTRLSAQQLLQSTENPSAGGGGKNKSSKKEGGEEDGTEDPAAEGEGGEGDGETAKTEAGTQEQGPAKVEEAQVETHDAGDPAPPSAAEAKPSVGEDGQEKEKPGPVGTGEDDKQPLLAAEEETAAEPPPERRKSSSSSSSSSAPENEQEKEDSEKEEEKDVTDGAEEPQLLSNVGGEADQSGLDTEPQPTEPPQPPTVEQEEAEVAVVQHTEPESPAEDPEPSEQDQPDLGTTIPEIESQKQPEEIPVQQQEEEEEEEIVVQHQEEEEKEEVTVQQGEEEQKEEIVVQQGEEEEEKEEEAGEEEVDSSGDEEEEALVAGGSRLMRAFVDGSQINLTSLSSSRTLRIIEDGTVNGRGGFGKKATFTVHVKGVRRVALQNVKDPDKWLQVKDDELSGNGTGDEHCHFNLREHGGYVVFEPSLAPGTHIGVRENGDIKKPSHTGTRKHARFTPIIKIKGLAGDSPLLAPFTNRRKVYLTSRASGKSLRIVEKQVNGLGGKGKKASFFVHVRRGDVIALQNVKDPQTWLRIRDSRLEGNGKGGRFCEFKVEENDGHVTLESVAAPGNCVGIDSEGSPTLPTDNSSQTAHFTPNIKLQKAGGGELLSRFTDDNVVVLESRASGKTLRFREGAVEGVGGHGALAQFIVHVKGPGIVALQNKKEPKQWLRVINGELNSKGKGGTLCHWSVQEVEGYVVLESVRFPGQHVGVRESGEVKTPSHTGKGKHAQFTPIIIGGDETETD